MRKYGAGMPLFRLEDEFARDGCRIDRGTMCRWVEDAGATCGATVVHAMRREALSASFCIATDATGVLVQPIRTHEKVRQACRRGHYFVLVADAEHVLFEYTPKEMSAAVRSMFEGFTGYVQADAKSVYDVLYRPPDANAADDDSDESGQCTEVACCAERPSRRHSPRAPSRAKRSRASGASSSSMPPGAASHPRRSSGGATCTCDLRPTRSPRGRTDCTDPVLDVSWRGPQTWVRGRTVNARSAAVPGSRPEAR
jgi:hypothetical protein